MIRMLLMTQLYYANGTYEFQNFNIIVQNVQECHELAPKALIIAAAEARVRRSRERASPDGQRGNSEEIIQTGHSCTDAQPYNPTNPDKKVWSF